MKCNINLLLAKTFRANSRNCGFKKKIWITLVDYSVFFGFTSPCSGPCKPEGAYPMRMWPLRTRRRFTTTLAEQDRREISITVTVRERKGEKELEKGGKSGGSDGGGV